MIKEQSQSRKYQQINTLKSPFGRGAGVGYKKQYHLFADISSLKTKVVFYKLSS